MSPTHPEFEGRPMTSNEKCVASKAQELRSFFVLQPSFFPFTPASPQAPLPRMCEHTFANQRGNYGQRAPGWAGLVMFP